MKPPMETHKPRMKERHVKYLTGLLSSIASFFSTVESDRAGVAAWEENCDSATEGLIFDMMFPKPMMGKLPTPGGLVQDKVMQRKKWKERNNGGRGK